MLYVPLLRWQKRKPSVLGRFIYVKRDLLFLSSKKAITRNYFTQPTIAKKWVPFSAIFCPIGNNGSRRGFTAVAMVVSRSIVRNGLVLKPHQHWLPLFLRFSSIKITTNAINMEILLFPHSCSSVKFCTPLSMQQAGTLLAKCKKFQFSHF